MEGGLKTLYFWLWLLAICVLTPVVAHADKVNGEWYSSARSLSMGNAGIANAEDPATAMFYNPAALARNKKYSFEFFNPHIEMGVGNFKLNNQTTKILSQSQLANADVDLQKNPEVPSYYAASFYPNFYTQNFSFGILGKYETSAYRRRQTNELLYRSRFLVVPTLGFSFGLFNGRLKFGLAPRIIQITENDVTTSTYNGSNGYFTNAQEGTGVALDSGMLLILPVFGLPTFGFVARNIGDTSFPGGAGIGMGEGIIGRHDSIKMTLDSGFSISPKLGKRSNITLSLDYRDTGNNSDTMAGRKINFGLEMDYNRWLYFRAGAMAGYWTTGIGFSGKAASLDIGTYGAELDPQKFQEVQDRRVFIRYGGRF